MNALIHVVPNLQTEVALLAPRLSGGHRLEPLWQAGHTREEGARDNLIHR